MEIELPESLKRFLEADERVLWSGRPARTPFVLKRFGPALVVGIAVLLLPLTIAGTFGEISGFVATLFGAYLPLWVGLTAVSVATPFVYAELVWRKTYYMITDRKVVIQTGASKIDYFQVKFEQVRLVTVNVGRLDGRVGSGTLVVQTTIDASLMLENVMDPFDVHELTKRAVDKVKSGPPKDVA